MSSQPKKPGRPFKKKGLNSAQRAKEWRNPDNMELAKKRQNMDKLRKQIERQVLFISTLPIILSLP